jgi:hypothetical protein
VNNGWLLESILIEELPSPTSQNFDVMTFSYNHAAYANTTVGDVYMLPSHGTNRQQIGTPCGCREQYFTVDGDFAGYSDRLEIWYKTDAASTNWIPGTDFWEGTGIFSNKKFCKPAGYGWMAFRLIESPYIQNTQVGSYEWDFVATRTYGTCPP